MTKLLSFFRFPIDPGVIRELRRRIKVSAGEIQKKRPCHNGHLEYALLVLVSKQLGNIEAQNFTDSGFFEPFIDR